MKTKIILFSLSVCIFLLLCIFLFLLQIVFSDSIVMQNIKFFTNVKPSFTHSESDLVILSCKYIKEKWDEKQKWSHSSWEDAAVHTYSSPASSPTHSILFLFAEVQRLQSKDAGVIIHPFIVSQNHLLCFQNRLLFKFPSSNQPVIFSIEMYKFPKSFSYLTIFKWNAWTRLPVRCVACHFFLSFFVNDLL